MSRQSLPGAGSGKKAFITGIGTAAALAWLAMLSALFCTPAYAGIYTYVDENGVRHYTNIPDSSRYEYMCPEIGDASYSAGQRERFDSLIKKAAARYGLDFALVKAIVRVESNFNPQAVSDAGAIGLMQLMPSAIKDFRITNPYDPHANIMAGTRYLSSLMEKFESNLRLSLAAYNAGPEAVKRYKGIPPYKETKNYVDKVMRCYSRYSRMEQ